MENKVYHSELHYGICGGRYKIKMTRVSVHHRVYEGFILSLMVILRV